MRTLIIIALLSSVAHAQPGWIRRMFGFSAPVRTVGQSLERSLPRPLQAKALGQLVDRVATLRQSGQRPVVIFDIDDTLMHENYETVRSRKIGGSLDYMKRLDRAGATIVYLTARSQRLGRLTQAQLIGAGFNLDESHQLMLHPGRGWFARDPAGWKTQATSQIRQFGTVVGAFDNDMENARTLRRELPGAAVFRLNTTSETDDPGGHGEIHVIDNYEVNP